MRPAVAVLLGIWQRIRNDQLPATDGARLRPGCEPAIGRRPAASPVMMFTLRTRDHASVEEVRRLPSGAAPGCPGLDRTPRSTRATDPQALAGDGSAAR